MMAKKKHILYRIPGGGEMYLTMKDLNQIVRDKGLDKAGDVQSFHTQNVLRRIKKFMPFRTGATIKLTIAQTDIHKPEIVTDVPHGKYIYYGKAMEPKEAPKKATDRDLKYTKTKNPQSGPFWDRALVAAEGDKLRSELQSYINRKAGKK